MQQQKNLECRSLKLSLHAFERIIERKINTAEIEQVLQKGEIIAEYITDKPFPSYLILGFIEMKPIHLVIAKDPQSGTCVVITAYVPDVGKWGPDFKMKK